MHVNERALRDLFDRVWNGDDLPAIDELIADRYTVVSDPGDPWEGRTLTRTEFRERMTTSKASFPDLHFDVDIFVPGEDHVAVSWTMTGTNSAPLGEKMPATGRSIEARGITIYHFTEGLISGHTQVTDRLAVITQLGLLHAPTPRAAG